MFELKTIRERYAYDDEKKEKTLQHAVHSIRRTFENVLNYIYLKAHFFIPHANPIGRRLKIGF